MQWTEAAERLRKFEWSSARPRPVKGKPLSGPMTTNELKTIVYRGGVVRFRIPADWEEEYEPAGGGMFYAPGDETGTLRLAITTFGAPAGKTLDVDDAEGFLAPFPSKYGVAVQPLRPGVAMIRYDLPASDRGHALKIRYWHVAQVIPPGHVRQSLFSYSVLEKLFDDRLLRQEMELLEREISVAEFAPVLGQTRRAT